MKKMLIIQGGGRPNGKHQISKTECLPKTYEFGSALYQGIKSKIGGKTDD